MSTSLARRQTLAQRLGMDEGQLETIRCMAVHPDAPDAVVELYLVKCRSAGVDPLDKPFHVIPRRQNVKDERTGEWRSEIRWQIQGAIDFFRSVAEDSGDYAGQKGPYFSNDGETWTEVWLDKEPPAVCKLAVLRKSFTEPLWVVGTYAYYVPRDGKGNAIPSSFWKGEKGAHQLAKCVEELALRKAFPRKLRGIYGDDEMEQAGRAVSLAKRQTTEPTELPAPREEATDVHFAALPPEPATQHAESRSTKPDTYREKAGRGAIKGFCRDHNIPDATYREWLIDQFGVDRFVDKETGEVQPTSKALDIAEIEQFWLSLKDRVKTPPPPPPQPDDDNEPIL